ncbi:hypothetical protein [Streptomyces flaveolus]|uniref:hypothetical protein n=1 Tax=Streptomyces flaveolus TaxID=67297 RepID=UPI00332B184C
MPDTDATWQKETRGGDDAGEPGPAAPRLYSLTTRYTDQFLGGQDGPDLLCDDAVAALYFALTVAGSSPLAVTCSATADGRTWARLPLHVVRADAVNALRQDVKPAMYALPLDNSRTRPGRPRAALSRPIEHAQADWLDSVLREPVDEVSAWVPDEPATEDWVRAGRLSPTKSSAYASCTGSQCFEPWSSSPATRSDRAAVPSIVQELSDLLAPRPVPMTSLDTALHPDLRRQRRLQAMT